MRACAHAQEDKLVSTVSLVLALAMLLIDVVAIAVMCIRKCRGTADDD